MRVPLATQMGRKQRLAMEAARAREEALKAERRMGEVFRGKELSKVKAFAEAAFTHTTYNNHSAWPLFKI